MEQGIERERWKRLTRLSDARVRRELGLQLIEGPRLVGEALRNGIVSELFVRDEASAVRWRERAGTLPVHVIGASRMERLADVKTPQDVIAVGPLPEPSGLGELLAAHAALLLLDGVQDPGNVGTLARTARALGVGALLLHGSCADPTAPKVLRSAAGALFGFPRARVEDLEVLAGTLGETGHDLVVPVVRGGRDLRETSRPERFVLVAGSEGGGTSLAGASVPMLRITIPMAGGVESLNVAAACAVILGRWL